ncbi:MAG: response regulator [Fimbriimonadaceae bacterium]|nr:response regulator [Alphaproteobacteria bacterium]
MAEILIAEDDEDVRATICRALKLAGHVIYAAGDGAEAMNHLHRKSDSTDLLLTDIKMPVMDGIALALSVAREWPDLPILMMTGFADQRERANGLETLIKGVLAKPFTLREIQDAVMKVLQEPQT